jgi:L-amino acid N-acyltransferase YncA
MSRVTRPPAIEVRDSRDADVSEIAGIYAHWVENGVATFELEPPDASEMAERRGRLLRGGYPYLVAEYEGGKLAGYAYAGPYRPRPAYRFACEDSVYVAPQATRSGIGRALLEALLQRCEQLGLRVMIAVIGDGTAASVRLHEVCGFSHSGTLPAVGWKHGRWVDTVLMTRPLGSGSHTTPAELTLTGEPAP